MVVLLRAATWAAHNPVPTSAAASG
jgi:hypothetical protein